jgi:hypothetical protein
VREIRKWLGFSTIRQHNFHLLASGHGCWQAAMAAVRTSRQQQHSQRPPCQGVQRKDMPPIAPQRQPLRPHFMHLYRLVLTRSRASECLKANHFLAHLALLIGPETLSRPATAQNSLGRGRPPPRAPPRAAARRAAEINSNAASEINSNAASEINNNAASEISSNAASRSTEMRPPPHVVNAHVQVQAQVGSRISADLGSRIAADLGSRVTADRGSRTW